MKTQIEKAKQYCKTFTKASIEYKEAMIYAKYGAYIGIEKCSQIAKN